MDVADRLAAEVGSVTEDSEARAQLGELSHRLLSASYSSDSGIVIEVAFVLEYDLGFRHSSVLVNLQTGEK